MPLRTFPCTRRGEPELKQKFPIGSLQTVDGKQCLVKRYGLPQAATYGASYPKVIFDEVEKEARDEER